LGAAGRRDDQTLLGRDVRDCLAVGDLVHPQVEGVQRADEVRYESRRRTLVDLSRSVDLLGDALVHDRDPV